MEKARECQRNIYFCFIGYAKAFDCVDHNKLWKILREMGIPDHVTFLLSNLYVGQEATVETGHGTTDWFENGKRVCQGCIFLPAILIPACNSSSPAFCMIYSAYKLNKQGDNIQPWCTPFLILNQSVVLHRVLTAASWPTYRFIRRQVRWSGIPISLRTFHSLLWSSQRLWCSWWNRGRWFPGIPLVSLWSSKCWQFDLWLLFLF